MVGYSRKAFAAVGAGSRATVPVAAAALGHLDVDGAPDGGDDEGEEKCACGIVPLLEEHCHHEAHLSESDWKEENIVRRLLKR